MVKGSGEGQADITWWRQVEHAEGGEDEAGGEGI